MEGNSSRIKIILFLLWTFEYHESYFIILYLTVDKPNDPEESQWHIFNYDQVVCACTGVQKFPSQPLVSTIRSCEEAKVHLDIPENTVGGRHSLAGQPHVEP